MTFGVRVTLQISTRTHPPARWLRKQAKTSSSNHMISSWFVLLNIYKYLLEYMKAGYYLLLHYLLINAMFSKTSEIAAVNCFRFNNNAMNINNITFLSIFGNVIYWYIISLRIKGNVMCRVKIISWNILFKR